MTSLLVAPNLISEGTPATLPHHEHDCEKCVYLGSQFTGADVDYWICLDENELIFRFGPDGDYGSAGVETAIALAAQHGPGTTWSQRVSRYDDWVASGQRGWYLYEIPVEEEFKTHVGLHNDLRVKETEKTIFFRDSAGNPLGVAQKDAFLANPGEETFAFRSEPLDGVGQSLFRQLIASRKALFLYVEFLLQTNLDAGG
jgi:hypothetical protein